MSRVCVNSVTTLVTYNIKFFNFHLKQIRHHSFKTSRDKRQHVTWKKKENCLDANYCAVCCITTNGIRTIKRLPQQNVHGKI